MVKNRLLCESDIPAKNSQKYGARGCLTCPLVGKKGDTITVNGKSVSVKKDLDCKSRNVIYLAQCKLCNASTSENTYTGQTSQPFHKRVNGHRACFVFKDGAVVFYRNIRNGIRRTTIPNEHGVALRVIASLFRGFI